MEYLGKRREILCAGLTALLLGGIPAAGHADTVQAPYYFGEYGFNLGGGAEVVDVSAPASYSGTRSSVDYTDSLNFNLSAAPNPSITVGASSTGGSAGAQGQIVYFFRLVGADGAVPTSVSYRGGISVDGAILPNTAASSYFAIGSASGNPSPLSDVYSLSESTSVYSSHTLNGVTTALGTSYAGTDTFDLLANNTYSINMSAYASVTGLETASAFVDPYIAIDPAYASQYSLEISDGIDNAPLAAAPIPASLPLFGTALLGLGGFGFSRKRKAGGAARLITAVA
jgi:hypothetical protein